MLNMHGKKERMDMHKKPPNIQEMADAIVQVTEEVKIMLLIKNEAYGNSVADPVRIFSKQADSLEQLNVRMDDKLSRLARGSNAGEDVEEDLLGYLVLKRAIKKFRDKQE